MVLENSYYWGRPSPFIRLLRRTGLGVAPLGSGAAPFVCRSSPVCPDNLPPCLRWIVVQLKRAESEQVFKRVPDLVRFAAFDSSRLSQKFCCSQRRSSIMYAYTCCRCTNCAAQIVLEEQGGSNTNLFRRPARPRAGREACPYCRTVFVPEKYYVAESETPLLQQALAPLVKRAAAS
jgi:hypothetical protein